MTCCRDIRRLVVILVASCTATALVVGADVQARAVNISNVWLLPEEGFPVFYRYFRDRITWFEADAVCQFHHAQLVTVDSSEQYDATRAYLKELDVVNHVWVGLKRSGSEGEFTWTDYKPLENGGYWQEQIPMTDNPVCAALDPAADFRWHPLNCGGPEVASFICQLEVPVWARKEDGCMLTSLPSLTVTYLPEQAAVELISDCGLEGTRRIACKGQANREEMMKQLSCETSTESQTEAASSDTWDNELPTRHRRDTDVTLDMASVQHIVPTTEGLTEVDVVEVTNNPPPAKIKETVPSTTGNPDTSSPQTMPQEMSVAEEPIKSPNGILPDEYQVQTLQEDVVTTNSTKVEGRKVSSGHIYQGSPVLIPIDGGYAGLTSDESTGSSGGGGRRVVLLGSSKPIPPSLKGNSPFIDSTSSNNNNNNKTERSNESSDGTTAKPVEKESHEVFRESTSDNVQQTEKQQPDTKAIKFPPLSIYTLNKDHDQDESSVRGSTQPPPAGSTESSEVVTSKQFDENDSNNKNDDSKFFTRVVAEELKVVGSTLKPTAAEKSSSNKAQNAAAADSDFLFIVTENPIKSSSSTEAPTIDNQTTKSPTASSDSSTGEPDDSLQTGGGGQFQIDDTPEAYAAAQDGGATDEIEPEAPERPNRGRLLIRPQHHSFYPYFLHRVLG